MSKITKIILLTTLCIVFLSAGTFAAIDKYNEVQQAKNSTTTKLLTGEDKIKEAQLKQKLNEQSQIVWKDIKDTFKIDEKSYKNISIEMLYSEQSIDGIDKEIKREVLNYIKEAPIGSYKPFILVKNDNKEVIVTYKDKDGVNILNKMQKSNEKLVKSMESKKGCAIPEKGK